MHTVNLRHDRTDGAILRTWALALAVLLAVLPAVALGVDRPEPSGEKAAGAVYAMTNSSVGNKIMTFARSSAGDLALQASVSSGGLGNDEYLGSAGSVTLAGRRWLLAVNPGSNSVAVFRIDAGREDDKAAGEDDDEGENDRAAKGLGPASVRLVLTDVKPSGGQVPVSVAISRDLVYVVNAGTANIAGFWLTGQGRLQPIAGSSKPLSSPAADPAQIGFGPQGRSLIVTEKNTNIHSAWAVDRESGLAEVADQHGFHPGHMQTPWGFAVDRRGFMVTAEAADGVTAASGVALHAIEDEENDEINLRAVSESIATQQTQGSALVLTSNQRFGYVANTMTNTITGFRITRKGNDALLDLLAASGVSGMTGPQPSDLALTRDSRFLYSLNRGDGSVSSYRVNGDGSLSFLKHTPGLPATANGLAAD